MNRESLIFCAVTLLATAAVCVVGFRLAALPPEAVAAAKRPAPPEQLPDVDLGAGFGKVSVIELVAHYIDNPPAAPARRASGAPAARRFGGC